MKFGGTMERACEYRKLTPKWMLTFLSTSLAHGVDDAPRAQNSGGITKYGCSARYTVSAKQASHIYSSVGGRADILGITLSIWTKFASNWKGGNGVLQNIDNVPGWCGSVDWVPACEPNVRQFDSQSGHMPGLRARVPRKGCMRGNHTWVFL